MFIYRTQEKLRQETEKAQEKDIRMWVDPQRRSIYSIKWSTGEGRFFTHYGQCNSHSKSYKTDSNLRLVNLQSWLQPKPSEFGENVALSRARSVPNTNTMPFLTLSPQAFSDEGYTWKNDCSIHSTQFALLWSLLNAHQLCWSDHAMLVCFVFFPCHTY